MTAPDRMWKPCNVHLEWIPIYVAFNHQLAYCTRCGLVVKPL